MKIIRIKELLFLALSVCVVFAFIIKQATAQQTSSRIGFNLEFQLTGIFSPVVSKVIVTNVSLGSQAQTVGLAVGDELIRVQDFEVAGSEASALKPHMEFVAGKPKKLVLRKPDGRTYEAILMKP